MNQPLQGMRIGLLTASASRSGGGVFEAVVRQAAMIREQGGEPCIFALRDRFSQTDANRFGACALMHAPVLGPAQIGYAPSLLPALLEARLDLLHLHGIWMYPSRAGAAWAAKTGRRYVVSPHGMLEHWIVRRNRWKKALARAGYERESWRRASVLHALTACEAADIARETGRSDSLIIPNPAPRLSHQPGPRAPVVVYIGRIHAKKNVLALVQAWSKARLPAGARLLIAGWGDPHDVSALALAADQAGPSVVWLGPVFGAAKQDLFDQARFTVLPSFSEGLPMAVLEGWSAGVPAILSEQCNLPEGPASGAAIVCATTTDGIAAALEDALGRDDRIWRKMSDAARKLAGGRYSPDTVARSWVDAYRRDLF